MKRREKVYCAFCRSQREIYSRKGLGVFGVLLILGATLLLGYSFFSAFDLKGLVLFVVVAAGAEAFLRFRWRMSLVCEDCGFDPILYKKDIPKVLISVQNHLQRRKEDPRFLLKPRLDLPFRRTQESESWTPGQRLSERV